MKKVFLFLTLFVMYASFAYSQLNTGSLFISGTTNLNLDLGTAKDVSVDGDKQKSTCFSVTPKAGYFIKNRIAVGGLFQYDYEGTRYIGPNSESKESLSEWYMGPLGRYYLEYGKIIPFAEISAAFGGSKETYSVTGAVPEVTHSIFRAAGGLGVNYLLNDHIALEGIIEYVYRKYKPTGEDETGEGYSEPGMSFKIGIAVFFGKI